MRSVPLLIAVLLAGYSSLELWFVPGSARPDSEWCKDWLCGTDAETQTEYQEYLQARAAQAPATVAGFAEILRRDPASAFRWCDLAEAMVESGQIEPGRYAIGQAVALAPHSAPILLRAVNFYLRIDDTPRALEYSRTILGQIADYDAMLFSDYDRFEIPVETVLRDGLPLQQRATCAYFSHLLGTARVTDAGEAWDWVREHGYADDALAGAYIAFLLRHQSYESAARCWVEYLGRRGGDFPKANLIYNGDFELAPTGSPLDWQIGKAEGVQIARDSSGPHSGKYSLALRFEGSTNVALSQVSQTVVIAPGGYRLEYFIRTSGITTNEGVRVRVIDPEHPATLDAVSEGALGDVPWERKELRFVAPAGTHLVQVQVTRLPSRKFDNKISGSAWVDCVRLGRAGS